MSIEDRLADGIGEGVDRAVLPLGDLGVATARGSRLRRRRRGTAVAATSLAVASVVVVASLVASGSGSTAPVDPAPATSYPPGWSRAAESPLSPRYGPLMVAVDDLVLVMGGHDARPLGPGEDLVVAPDPDADLLADAAAYDVEAGTWANISDPPFAVDRDTPAVVSDGLVVLAQDGAWFAYDSATDAWSDLPAPPSEATGPQDAEGGLVYARQTDESQGFPGTPTNALARDVLVLDVVAREWSSLPADPLTPQLDDGAVVVTDAGVVVTGDPRGNRSGERDLTVAALWDGTSWIRLPVTGQVGPLRHWTGSRIVGLGVGDSDGPGGRRYPDGGSLDPATGVWAPIPDLNEETGSADSWYIVAEDGPLMARYGLVYDDRSRTWTALGRPDSPVDTELTAVWSDEHLVVFGGYDTGAIDDAGLSAATWVWTRGGEPTRPPDVEPPTVEGDPATWRLREPEEEPLVLLQAEVTRIGCNSGVTGTVLPPTVDYQESQVVVTFQVDPADATGADCQGNAAEPYDVPLSEPLDDRPLVDGACLPGTGNERTSFCLDGGVRYRPRSS